MRGVLGMFLVVAVVLVGGACGEQTQASSSGAEDLAWWQSDENKCLSYAKDFLKKYDKKQYNKQGKEKIESFFKEKKYFDFSDFKRCPGKTSIEDVCRDVIGNTSKKFASTVKENCGYFASDACDGGGKKTIHAAKAIYDGCMYFVGQV
ncbi:MAG: hypothetical protein AAF471_05850 [Myxococcota bacterium]